MKYLETFKFFNEKMALDNYDEYAELVANAYEDAPEYDETMIPSYKSLINHAATLAPPDALPALFTEVVGQACYAIDRGSVGENGDFIPGFGGQKFARLNGFDYRNVGEVKDRQIVNKKLI